MGLSSDLTTICEGLAVRVPATGTDTEPACPAAEFGPDGPESRSIRLYVLAQAAFAQALNAYKDALPVRTRIIPRSSSLRERRVATGVISSVVRFPDLETTDYVGDLMLRRRVLLHLIADLTDPTGEVVATGSGEWVLQVEESCLEGMEAPCTPEAPA